MDSITLLERGGQGLRSKVLRRFELEIELLAFISSSMKPIL